MVQLGGEYYLIGSIRQDASTRYWRSKDLGRSWSCDRDNVVLPPGNYAGRVCRDNQGWLIWSFFSIDPSDRSAGNVMPPPKRLVKTDDGYLRTTTYEEFENWLKDPIDVGALRSLKDDGIRQRCNVEDDCVELQSELGYRAFVLEETIDCFRFRAKLNCVDAGQYGIVFRIRSSNTRWLLPFARPMRRRCTAASLETRNKVPQCRSSKQCSPAVARTESNEAADIQLLGFGSYIELSVDGYVVLSLVDQIFSEGLLGVYLDSAKLKLANLDVHRMQSPGQADEHLAVG